MSMVEGVPEPILQCPTFLKSVLYLIASFSAHCYCVKFSVEHVYLEVDARFVFGRCSVQISARIPVILTGIPRSLQANVGIVPLSPKLLPSKFFPIRVSSIFLSSDAV
jgi:hypothetical protein